MVSGQMSTQVLIDSLSATDGRGKTAVLHVLTDADYDLTRFMHAHPHGELFLLRSGFVKSHSAAGQWLIPAGHLCWIPPGAAHGAETDRIRGVRIHLSAELCRGLPSEPRVLASTPIILAIIDRLAADARPRMSLSPPEANLLKVLLDEISGAQGLPIVLPMPNHAALRNVAQRWLQQPDDDAGLDELAAAEGLSRRSLTRNFKAETGLSVGRWRQLARLLHGVELLAAGKSVTETAFLLGYDSVSSFVMLCHRHTGLSPAALARAVGKAPTV